MRVLKYFFFWKNSRFIRVKCASWVFFSCNSFIFSSMEFFTISRYTFTTRSCPIRYTRSIPCSSTAGFHSGYTIITLFASTRLSPSPHILREVTSPCNDPILKLWRSYDLASFLTLLCKATTLNPKSTRLNASCSITWIHMVNIMHFSPLAMISAASSITFCNLLPQ